jgi:hypothetical protein
VGLLGVNEVNPPQSCALVNFVKIKKLKAMLFMGFDLQEQAY